MGHIDVNAVEYSLSDGRVLLSDVNFRVGEGAKVALIGANGSGKTTLIRMISGDLQPESGAISISGALESCASSSALFAMTQRCVTC
jgi:ABC-type polysaccharide/polyol phosphate transport system ATPase subunit